MIQFSNKEISEMSYTDFVGFINQWNVLPGAYNTLNKWGVFSRIDNKSRVLELACTSGFSLRELANMFNCSGVGIDISKESVQSAIFNKDMYNPNLNIEYSVDNGDSYENKEKFTHVVVGAALKFFPNPEHTIKRIVNNYLEDGGCLLVSPFYAVSDVPDSLFKECQRVFGIDITNTSYKDNMKLYKDFEIIYEDKNPLVKETEEELAHYCESTINRACEMRNISDQTTKQIMYERLMEIKKMSNALRDYQNYSTLVLRYRKNIFPNRYTELF